MPAPDFSLCLFLIPEHVLRADFRDGGLSDWGNSIVLIYDIELRGFRWNRFWMKRLEQCPSSFCF
ncbi:hypothetical protein SETIT_5G331700v2 [Setaria italica]|uniref:Uncharacterized protein n=1 Tax=Setaria italica TaxID=4555 RepID=A0A368RBI1_SETIT|nr:hypothetical protein SETIT_5G331700v2 [Setaria italica]